LLEFLGQKLISSERCASVDNTMVLPHIAPRFSADGMVGYPSGQRGLTVNQLAYAFAGSNPAPTTTRFLRLCAAMGRKRILQIALWAGVILPTATSIDAIIASAQF
jgi:hypothetical protein